MSERVMETLRKIRDDLKFCEENLRKEVRLELTKLILDELMSDIERIRREKAPRELQNHIEDLALRIRLLYHRASVLSSLREEARR